MARLELAEGGYRRGIIALHAAGKEHDPCNPAAAGFIPGELAEAGHGCG